ncbi:hypothetical protein [uncultured Veillonella sp.]|uniref:hypothetical protein n=1 Tax=uncultured Veillonella sp. TaxID=159268 RepID=UPI00265AA426|nr:hypothetical protein [uncultured Veillonella sp.]
MNWKRVITLGLLGLTVGMGQTYAIDVNIPGATAKIDEMSYRDYRPTGRIIERIDSEISKDIDQLKATDQNYTKDELQRLKYVVQGVNHATNHSYTVYVLKENGADLTFTMPFSSVATISKNFKENHVVSHQTVTPVGNIGVEVQQIKHTTNWADSQVPYSEVTKDVIREQIDTNHDGKISFIDGDTFTYKTVENGTWDIANYGKYPNGTINFTVPGKPNTVYHVGYGLNENILKYHIKGNQKELVDKTMATLANFALPSIKPASSVLEYSSPVSIGNYTFRVLKGSKLVDKKKDKDGNEFTRFASGSIHSLFIKHPVSEPILIERQAVFYKYLTELLSREELNGMKGVQYATVWNDATPGAYFEVEGSEKTLFIIVVYDDRYVYSYYTLQPNDVHLSKYKIRDMIQYISSKVDKNNYDTVKLGLGVDPRAFDTRWSSDF